MSPNRNLCICGHLINRHNWGSGYCFDCNDCVKATSEWDLLQNRAAQINFEKRNPESPAVD